jgi:hypothetical protein
MGWLLDTTVLPGLESPIIPRLSHTFGVTAIQKGIYPSALEHILGHDHLTATEI